MIQIRCLRAWTAHNASYSPGEEYRVPEFIAAILKRGRVGIYRVGRER